MFPALFCVEALRACDERISLGARFAFDDSGVRQAAEQVGGTFAAPTEFSSCGDCGSALAADIVRLFTDQLAQAILAAQKGASGVSASMTACADDFNQVETTNVQASRHLLKLMGG